ncbi:hypothetical protein AMQ28_09235 [Acinetobacter sp. TTH0-4]|uniref:hypothetical protein n=1 Tax=Acinetobacter sp. TTH0-4 TaxID=1646498 RepID=UPI0006AFD5C0|nr:hypothetical protein [Acinetobacter sp. TTH0-4]ALD02519.1 hypothetical protein AMQ28_09235 [Acinetobacter sp. TTH0-4]
MNKFLLSFRRIFAEELVRIQHEDDKKIEQNKKNLVLAELNEELVIRSAKNYIERGEKPKRA